MLATLTTRTFSDPGWVFERKLDGERCLAFRQGRAVRLMSRNRKRVNNQYPEIVEALLAQDADDFVVDGEVVAFDRNRTSFTRLQRRMHVADPERARGTGVPVLYYFFDILHAAGKDTTGVPLRHRKEAVRALLSFEDPLRFTEHRDEKGEQYLREACRRGWEGLIAKRADAPYKARATLFGSGRDSEAERGSRAA
jgi:ATP-dependent DNA ligase